MEGLKKAGGHVRTSLGYTLEKVKGGLAYYPLTLYLGVALIIFAGFVFWAHQTTNWTFDWLQFKHYLNSHATDLLILFSGILGLVMTASAIAYKQCVNLSEQDYILWLRQQGTRVFFPAFTPIHDWLRLRSRLYAWWHSRHFSGAVHFLILLLAIFGIGQYVFNNISSVQASGCAGTTTITTPTTWSTNQCLGDVTVSNGATLTINGGITADLVSLTLGDASTNGFITAKGDTLNNLGVVINTDNNLEVKASSTISANGQGYTGGTAPGSGNGPGGGAGSSSIANGGGGAYGGNGGTGAACCGYGQGPGGTAYGSLNQPVDLGSGGGASAGSNHFGGNGGGAIKINTAGTLTISGSISANGGNSTASNDGGGSGGSIWLIAGTLNGAGTITANGGGPSSAATAGAGSGGRVQVTYTTNTSSITPTATTHATLGVAGAPGTVMMNSDLTIDGSTLATAASTPLGDSSYTLTSTTFKGTGITIPVSSSTTLSGGALSIPSGSVTLNIDKTGPIPSFTTINLANGATLTQAANTTTHVYSMILTASSDVTIAGTLNMNSNGYIGNTAPANGNGPGGGAGSSSIANGGGGAYGGNGGTGAACCGYGQGPGGTAYGSLDQPTDLGSSGGSSAGANHFGGRGGGAVKISSGGTLTVSGSISANGGNGTASNDSGGSGGSIWLIANTFTGNGTLSANGGGPLSGSTGGAGGGGRIKITYTSNTSSITPTAKTHATLGVAGAPGTVMMNSDLTVDGGTLSTVATTPFSDSSYSLTGTTFKGTAIIVSIGSSTTFSGGAFSVPSGTVYLNINKTAPVPSFSTMNVAVGATLTQSANGTSHVYSMNMTASSDVTIAGTITTTGKGFIGGTYPGTPGYGSGGGASNGWCRAGGGGYGGGGGTGDTTYLNIVPAGGGAYGSATSPTDIGSGGGDCSGTSNTNASGGGAIKLTSNGNISLTGSVASNGGTSTSSGGGGSGGSVWLVGNTYSGAGTVTANGGNANSSVNGAGGGGRIQVTYSSGSLSFTPTAFTGSTGVAGAPGTVMTNSDLTVDGTTLTTTAATPFSDASYSLTSTTFKGTAIVVSISSATTFSGGALSIPSGSVTLNIDKTGPIPSFTTINLANGATLTQATNTTIHVYSMNLSGSGNVTIAGTLSLNTKGFSGGTAPGNGYGTGGGVGAGGYNYGGGGGYGGHGGDSINSGGIAGGGSAYGSVSAPTDLGSGGGAGAGSGHTGGAGGGVVKISSGGTLTVSGSITTNGGNGSGSSDGGGSGGSIWLIGDTLTGSGTITANGGSPGSGTNAGCGGGGRIARDHITADSLSGTVSVTRGSGNCTNGTNGTNITVGAATALTVDTLPANVASGTQNSIRVTAIDGSGYQAGSYAGTIHFTSTDGDGGVVLPGNYAFTVGDSGSHTFTNGVKLITLGAQTVTATDTVTGSITGNVAVTVRSGTASQTTLSAVTAITGTVTSVTIATQNSFSDTCNVSSDTAFSLTSDSGGTWAFYSDSGGTSIITSKTISANTNTVTFYYKDTLTGNHTLTATRTSGDSVTAGVGTVTYNPGAIASYSLSANTSQTAGTGWSETATAKDAYSNTVTTNSTTVITMTKTGSPLFYTSNSYGSATTTYTLSSGVATVYIKDLKAESITYTATDPNAKTGTSSSISVSPASLTKLLTVMGGEAYAPGTGTGRTGTPTVPVANKGSAFTVTIYATDDYYNTVTSATPTVAITTSSGTATLPGNAALIAGTKTFNITENQIGRYLVTASDVSHTLADGTSTNYAIYTNGTGTNITGSTTWTTDHTYANDLVIGNSATVTIDSATKGSQILLTVGGDLFVDTGASLNANGKGYAGGTVGSKNGQGSGGGINSTSYGGGGAYGGNGATHISDINAIGGTVYGSSGSPTDFGSGSAYSNGYNGGAGGGALKLSVTSTLTNMGTITANGGVVGYSGGAGGSIWIICNSLAGNGSILVNGGSGNGVGYGNGGGGRIKISSTSDTSTMTVHAYGGAVDAGAGTIITSSGLTISNNASAQGAAAAGITPLLESSYSVSATTIQNGANVTIANGTTYAGGTTVIQGGARMALMGTTAVWSGGALTVQSNTNTISTYAGQVTEPSFSSINIASGTLNHDANSTTDQYHLVLASTGNVTVTGNITLDGKGYLGGTSSVKNGYGPGGGISHATYGGGGGYGGTGSNNYSDSLATGGVTYGSVDNPTDLGSGGAYDNGYVGGNGGGAVKIDAPSGTVTIGGTVSANGSSVGYSGGSGGSVWIIASTLSGGGNVTANGYCAGGGCGSGGYAPGGGGRVRLTYSTDNSTVTRTAYGFWNTIDGSGAGTVATSSGLTISTASTSQSLTGTGTTPLNDASYSYTATTIQNGAIVTIGASATFSGGATTIQNGGWLTLANGANYTATTVTVQGGAKVVLAGVNSVISGTTFSVPSGTNTFTVPTGIVTEPTFSGITIGGTLKHDANSTADSYHLILKSTGDVTIASGAFVNVDGLGYAGAVAGSVLSGSGPGGGNSTTNLGSGGGYGGNGGTANLGAISGGSVYGSMNSPTDLGSGGGATSCGSFCSYAGGNGGGAIKITATGNLNVLGSISTTGTNGYCRSGGGSGGSIWLVAGTLSGNGTVAANGGQGGGDGGSCASTSTGAGAGGRVQVTYTTNNSSITPIAYTSTSYGTPGGAGTIMMNTDLTISTNAAAQTNPAVGLTTMGAGSYSPSSTTIQNGANVLILDGVTYSGGTTTIQGGAEVMLAGTGTVWSGGSLTVQTNTNIISIPPSIVTVPTFNSISVASGTLKSTTASGILFLNSTGDFTVASGVLINVDGLGYAGAVAGSVLSGSGPGGGNSTTNLGSGGGYGGNGGTANSGAILGGSAYGSIGSPTDLGSGGGATSCGSFCSYAGGNGGGAIKITVTGNLNVLGTISAAGTSGYCRSGGGSGGSIWLVAGTLSGNGTVAANGGQGGGDGGSCASTSTGAGAGGRTTIAYNSSDANLVTSANSGAPYGTVAGAGTISSPSGLLISKSTSAGASVTAGVTPLNDASYSYQSLTIQNGSNVTIANNTTFSGGTSIVQGGSAVTILGTGTVWSGGSLTVQTNTNTINVPPSIVTVPTFSSISVASGTLNHSANSATDSNHLILASSGNVTIASGAIIDSNGKGYIGGGANLVGNGPGAGSGGSSNGGGGGHGGRGGDGASSGGSGGVANDTTLAPVFSGSGGGGGSGANTAASGGGAIKISAAGTLTMSGTINSNGTNSAATGGGGGSGGAVWLVGSTLAGNGAINAKGGNGYTSVGGCGGGGIVALHYTSSTYSGAVSVTKGTGNCTNGADGTNQSPGSVTHFSLTGTTSPITAGGTTSVTVTALDGSNNTNSAYTGTIHFTSSDGQAILPSNYPFVVGDAGVHTFTNGVTLKTAGSKTITATDGSITGTSSAITVNPTSAVSLSLTGISSLVTAGVSQSMNVIAKDTYNNTATGYTGTVHFTSTDSGATLPNNYAFVGGDSGSHNFSVTLITTGSQTVTATDTVTGSITGTHSSVTVNPSVNFTLSVAGLANPIVAGVPGTPTITIRDEFNNIATNYTGTVHFSANDTLASLPPDYVFHVSDAGTVTLTDAVQFGTAGSRTLTVRDTVNSSIVGTQTVTVNPSSTTNIVITSYPSTLTAGSVSTAYTVARRDVFGNATTSGSQVVDLASNSTGTAKEFRATSGGVPTSSVTINNAASTTNFYYYDEAAGSWTVSISASGLTGDSKGLTVNTGVANNFLFSGLPSSTTAGNSLSASITVRDVYNNTVVSYTGTVHFSSIDSQAVLPGDYTFVGGNNGYHNFSSAFALKTAGTQSVTVTDSTVSATKSGIVVSPASSTSLTMTGVPSAVNAGALLTPVLNVRDAYGNITPGATGLVHFSSTDVAATVPIDYTMTVDDAGGHTFTDQLHFATVGTQSLSVTVTNGGTLSLTQENIAVSSSGATTFIVSIGTSSVVAGSSHTATVTAKDSFGNTDAGYVGTIHFTSSDSQAVLPGNYTFVGGNNGVHTFTNGISLKTAGSQSVTTTDTNNGSITGSQSGVTVTPAAAASLVVSGVTDPVVAGLSSNVSVTAKDAYSNTATGYTGTVAFSSNDTQADLPSNYDFVGGNNGTHSFSGGVTLKTAGEKTVTATDTGNGSITGTQSAITVTPAVVASLVVSGVADPVVAGVASDISVTAKDAYSNTATGYTGTVAFTSNDTQATLSSDYTFVGGDNGTHTFSNGITLKTAGEKTATATDTNNGSVVGTQLAITVTSAVASTLVLGGITTPVTAGDTSSPVVTAKDQFNNTATGYSGVVHFTSTDSQAELPADHTFTGGDAGTHTFTNGVKIKTAGSQTVTVADTGNGALTVTSDAVTVAPAAASHLVVSSADTTIQAGTPISVVVNAFDQFGNTASGYSGTVHFTSSDSAASLPANYTFTGSNAGAHLFTDGVTFQTAGTQSVTATDNSNSQIKGTLNGVTVSAAPTPPSVPTPVPSPVLTTTPPPTQIDIILIIVDPVTGSFTGIVNKTIDGKVLELTLSGVVNGSTITGLASGTYGGLSVTGSLNGTVTDNKITSGTLSLTIEGGKVLSVILGGEVQRPNNASPTGNANGNSQNAVKRQNTNKPCKLQGTFTATINGQQFIGTVSLSVSADGSITGTARGKLDGHDAFATFKADSFTATLISGELTITKQTGKPTDSSGSVVGQTTDGSVVLTGGQNCQITTTVVYDVGDDTGDGTAVVTLPDTPVDSSTPITAPTTGTVSQNGQADTTIIAGTVSTKIDSIVLTPNNPTYQTLEVRDVSAAALVVVSGISTLPLIPAVQTTLMTSSIQGGTFFNWFFFGYAPTRRRRRKWGAVHDSVTGLPAPGVLVSLIDVASGEVLKHMRTDRAGRYGFLVDKSGEYKIVINDPLYQTFESKVIKR